MEGLHRSARMTTLEQIHAELERLRNHRFLLGWLSVFALALVVRGIFEMRHENKRAAVYREIAVEAMMVLISARSRPAAWAGRHPTRASRAGRTSAQSGAG